MAYVVKITNSGGDYFLRGRIWAFSMDRATRYESADMARDGLNAARTYTKPAMFKLARIVPVV